MRFQISVISYCSLSVLIAIQSIFACAGGDEGWAPEYLFDSELLDDRYLLPLKRDVNASIFDCSESAADLYTANIMEWKNFLGNGIPEKEIEYALYNMTLTQIDTAIFFLKKKISLPKPPDNLASLLTTQNVSQVNRFLYYTGFARRCEPFTVKNSDSWRYETVDSAAVRKSTRKLIDGALKQLADIREPFVRERYLFQIVRLYFVSGWFEDCISFYQRYGKEFTVSESIKYRSLSYIAGAWYRLKNYTKANLLYAEVFDKYPPLRCTSGFSFHPESEEDGSDPAINEAESVRIKEVLWLLRGLYGDPVQSIKEIYAINPSSELSALLCVRSVNLEEERLLNHGLSDNPGVAEDLLETVRKIADEHRSGKPLLWNCAAAHLLALNGDPTYQKYIKNSIAKNNIRVKQQIDRSNFTGMIMCLRTKDSLSVEKAISSEILDQFERLLSSDTSQNYFGDGAGPFAANMRSWADRNMAEIFRNVNCKIRAQMLDPGSDFYSDNNSIEELIAFLINPSKSRYDSMVIDNYLSDAIPSKIEKLRHLQALNAAVAIQPSKALEYLKMSGDNKYQSFKNPFAGYWNKRTDTKALSEDDTGHITKEQIFRKLAMYEELSRSDSKNSAEGFYRIGNFLFNISEDGTTPEIRYTESEHFSFYEIKCYSDEAKKYFEKALKLNPSKELKARIYAMMAQCDIALAGYYEIDNLIEKNFKPVDPYALLAKECKDTRFYKEIIRECGYFRRFVGKK